MLGFNDGNTVSALSASVTSCPFFSPDNQFILINLSNVKPFSSAANLLLSVPKVATFCVGECTSHQREDPALFYFILFFTFSVWAGHVARMGGRERSVQGAGGETRGEETAGETQA